MSRFRLRATAIAAAVAVSFAGVSVATAAPASDVDKGAAETATTAPKHDLKLAAKHRALEVFHQVLLGEALPSQEEMDATMAEELAEKYGLDAEKLAAVWKKTDAVAVTLNHQLVAVEKFIAKVTGKDQEEIHDAVLEALMKAFEKDPALAELMKKYHSELAEEAEATEAETAEAEAAQAEAAKVESEEDATREAEEAPKAEETKKAPKAEKAEKAVESAKSEVSGLKTKVESLLKNFKEEK